MDHLGCLINSYHINISSHQLFWHAWEKAEMSKKSHQGLFFLRWSEPWEPTGGHRPAGCDPAASLPNTVSASPQPGGRVGGEEPRWSEAQCNSPLIYQPTPCLCPFYLYDDDVAADGGRWKLHSDLRRRVWDGMTSKNTTAAPHESKRRRPK